MRWPIGLITGAGQHRCVILYSTDVPWVVWPVLHGSFEHHPLVVAFALPFRLDAVSTRWPLFAAFNAALSTSEASSLGTFSHLRVRRGPCGVSGWRNIASTTCW
jgi:hypothetical protein